MNNPDPGTDPKLPTEPTARPSSKPALKDLKPKKDVKGGGGPRSSPIANAITSPTSPTSGH